MEWFDSLGNKELLVLGTAAAMFLVCLYQLWQYHRAEWKYAAKNRLKNAAFLFVLSLLAVGSVFMIPGQPVIAGLETLPVYESEPYAVINHDEPFFTDEEKDAVGEVANISMGSSATTLYSLVNQKVNITTPQVELANWENVISNYERPCVFIQIRYTVGLDGTNILILKEHAEIAKNFFTDRQI